MLDKASVENARIFYYSLLSKLFVFTYEKDRFNSVLLMLEAILKAPIDQASQNALKSLCDSFKNENIQNVADEYDQIFHAPPNPVRSTISFYDEGYEFGVSCLNVKKMLAKTNIRRDEKKYLEKEDNFGFIFTLMGEFLKKYINGDELYGEYAKELFETFLNPYVDEFISAIYIHENSYIYKNISILMHSFFEFERVYYEVVKPQKEINKKVIRGISRSEMVRRETNRARKNKGENNASR